MYQQAPQSIYQPQYAPQYGGQNVQQYQGAPPQYVPSGYPMAPPQPVMMNEYGRGPGGYARGQGPPNPCSCCKWCCGGTCSLRTGVIIIGINNLLGCLGQLIRAALISAGAASMDVARFSPYASILFYADGFIFWLVSGIIALIGAGSLQTTSCCIAGVLMAIGGPFHLGVNIYIAMNIPSYADKMGESAGTYFSAIAGCLFRLYLGYCVYALGKQIENGEYKVGMPQPMMGMQPMVGAQPMIGTQPPAYTAAPSAAMNAQPNPPPIQVQNSGNQEG